MNKKMSHVKDQCFVELYKAAEPSTNWKYLQKKGITKNPNFYLGYFLEKDTQNVLIEKIGRKNRLSDWEIRVLRQQIHSAGSPTCSRAAWEAFKDSSS